VKASFAAYANLTAPSTSASLAPPAPRPAPARPNRAPAPASDPDLYDLYSNPGEEPDAEPEPTPRPPSRIPPADVDAEKPEPYKLQAPPTIDLSEPSAKDFVADAGAVAAELGLSQELAQEALTALAMDAEFPTLPEFSGSSEQAEATLQQQWGRDFEDNLALARWSYKNAGPRVQKALDQSGLGNHPSVVAFLARDGARSALDMIFAQKDHPLHDAGHRGHKAAIQTVRWLTKLAGR
jgi:hypothetical protein